MICSPTDQTLEQARAYPRDSVFPRTFVVVDIAVVRFTADEASNNARGKPALFVAVTNSPAP